MESQTTSEVVDDPLMTLNKMEEVMIGMPVEAKDSYGKWFSAKVVEKDEETEEVLVHFDGWSSRYDEFLHIGAGRLRRLSQEQLKKRAQKALKNKNLQVGDRVQAKWQDGRMYFGKVLELLKDMAVVLFDDGVQYTTPITAVRKRRVDPSASGGESSYLQSEGRKRKMAERTTGREDYISQDPSISPPSSPLFAPKRIHARSSQFWEGDESSYTESDVDEEGRKRQRSHLSPPSDSELRPPTKRGKRRAKELREPYKLRRQPMSRQSYSPLLKTSPKKKPTSKGSSSSGGEGGPGKIKKEEGQTENTKKSSELEAAVDDDQQQDIEKEETKTPPNQKSVRGSKDSENPPSPSLPALSPVTPSLLPSTPHSPSLTLSPSLPLPPATPQPASPTSEPDKELAHRSASDITVPKSPSKPQSFTPSRRRSSTSQGSSVNTRFRAQTAFENSKKGKDRGRQGRGKVAPKELVIVWDHNEFKCPHAGCTKSFRKQSLLQSHMKHYHSIPIPSQPKGKKGKTPGLVTKSQGDKTSAKSPQSPQSPLFLAARANKSSLSPSPPLALATEPPPSQQQAPPTTPTATKKSRLPQHDSSTVGRNDRADGAVGMGGGSSRSPKKGARQKSAPQRPPNPMETDTMETPTASIVQSQQKASQQTAGSQPSKYKSSMKKPREKARDGGASSRRGEVVKLQPSQLSPSIPLSNAANLPVQRMQSNKEAALVQGQGHDLASGSEQHEWSDLRPGTSGTTERGGMESKGSASIQAEGPEQMSRSVSPSSEVNDDVVHCVCADETDEGFMIQCEQCLCWQHGDCIGIAKDTLPEKYICYFCINPPGLRQNKKYQYDLQWYSDGTLPSLPGGPKFPCPEAILKCHSLLDRIYQLRKMSHSSKVKLQAARNPNHAYLRQWSKECACLDKETLKNYLATALEPVVVREPVAEKDGGGEKGDTGDNGGSGETATDTTVKQEGGVKREAIIEGVYPLAEGRGLTNGEEKTPEPMNQEEKGLNKERTHDFETVTTQVLTSSLEVKVNPMQSGGSSAKSEVEPAVAKEEPPASHSSGADTDPNITSEFGVQETTVFAVKDGRHLIKQSQQPSTTLTPDTQSTGHTPTISTQKILQTGTQSAFKPIILSAKQSVSPGSSTLYTPKTPTSSQLTSLLTSPISTQPLVPTNTLFSHSSAVNTPSPSPTQGLGTGKHVSLASASSSNNDATNSSRSPSVPTSCVTQLSRLNLVPNVSGDAVYAETAASLSPAQLSPPPTPVLLKDFTEAFVHGDTTNWFKRMILLDHIENVQDGILGWIEQMEREADELSAASEEDEEKDWADPSTLAHSVRSTLDQLSTYHQQVIGNKH